MTDIRIGPFGPLPWIDLILLGWFALTALSVAYVAWDAYRNNPELTVMKWGLDPGDPLYGPGRTHAVRPVVQGACSKRASAVHPAAVEAPTGFAYATATLETLTALGLIFGFARRVGYFVGFSFSLLIWTTAEGFGGPYTAGSVDVGAGIIYALFIALYLLDAAVGPSPLSLDRVMERRVSWWSRLAEPSGRMAEPTDPAVRAIAR